MEEEAMNFIKAWLKVIASISYSYFISSKFPKGILRFFSLLPIFYLFTILPLSLSRPIPSIILSGFFTWIANFKLLLYSFNLGPLSTPYPQSSFLKFFVLAAFPIAIKDQNIASGGSDVRSLTPVPDKPTKGQNTSNTRSDVRSLTPVSDKSTKDLTLESDKSNNATKGQNTSRGGPDVHSLNPEAEKSKSATMDQNTGNERSDVRSFTRETDKVVPLNYGTKVLGFILLEVVYTSTKSKVVLCGLMYLFIDILFGACDLLVKSTLGVELEPPSNEPYLSTSLQDFWGKRWNRMISTGLRQTIYDPTKSMATKVVGPRWAPLVGVMGCFLVSGLMHELVYFHMTRASPTWEVTWFFVLHGFCVVLEMVVKRRLGREWRLHWALSGPLTVGFVMVTGFWLFFPQIMRSDVDKLATEDIIGLAKYVREMINLV